MLKQERKASILEELLELLRNETQELSLRFERSSIEGRGTSQEVSDFREHAIQSFLERFFPFPFRICKGGIYDSNGLRSDSIDCIILNPVHPHTIDSRGKHSFIIADGVDAAVEVKPDISSHKELERGLIQGISVKKLSRVQAPVFLNAPQYIIDHSRKIPFFIFSMKSKNEISTTYKEIKAYYIDNSTPLIEQLDIVVINNRGLLINYKYKEEYPFVTKFSDEQKSGWFFEEWGLNTLAGFLYHLNRVHPSIVRMEIPALSHYVGTKFINHYLGS
jgi:hypothetical protein